MTAFGTLGKDMKKQAAPALLIMKETRCGLCLDELAPSEAYFASAISSISTRAFFGKVFTAKAERAGNGAWKNSA